jgi:hypothetical protein
VSILTLGHSTHTPEQFLRVCNTMGLDAVIDVRSHPTSHWDWWRQENMDWVPTGGITLAWEPRLGGWAESTVGDHTPEWGDPRGVDLRAYLKGVFPKQRIGVAKKPEGLTLDGNPDWVSGWTNQGLHDYAWYTSTAPFLAGLRDLADNYGRNDQPRVGIFCAEMLWWKCHRSMIADVLDQRGVPVYHITPRPDGRCKADRHDSKPRVDRYPLEVRKAWIS